MQRISKKNLKLLKDIKESPENYVFENEEADYDHFPELVKCGYVNFSRYTKDENLRAYRITDLGDAYLEYHVVEILKHVIPVIISICALVVSVISLLINYICNFQPQL